LEPIPVLGIGRRQGWQPLGKIEQCLNSELLGGRSEALDDRGQSGRQPGR